LTNINTDAIFILNSWQNWLNRLRTKAFSSQTIPAVFVFIPNDATKFTFQNTETYVFYPKNFLSNVHTNSSGSTWPVLYSFFLHIFWQLIENDTGWMSRQQENKNLLRKRQTCRPRLKPGSERERHTSFSHASSVTYLQIFTTNFNFL
jgi:hypothetical protein